MSPIDLWIGGILLALALITALWAWGVRAAVYRAHSRAWLRRQAEQAADDLGILEHSHSFIVDEENSTVDILWMEDEGRVHRVRMRWTNRRYPRPDTSTVVQ